MQRNDADGMVIISCDFCGDDWDEVKPMIEGHHGSVLCLRCVERAISDIAQNDTAFHCTLCLQEHDADVRCYKPQRKQGESLPPGANVDAMLCISCLNQAAGAFSKDPDTDWKRPEGKI